MNVHCFLCLLMWQVAFITSSLSSFCNLSNYDTAYNDTSISYPSIPEQLNITSYESKEIDITSEYYWYPVGSPTWYYPGWEPIYNETENSLTVAKHYGGSDYYGSRAFGGTIFPTATADGLFDMWNYYDHAEMWYRLSFQFRQNELHMINEDGYPSAKIWLSVAIFDMLELNTEKYPNINPNDTWKNFYFGQKTCGYVQNNTVYECNRSAFELILSQESKNEGINLNTLRNWWNETVWINFPLLNDTNETILSKKWNNFSVTFKFDNNEDTNDKEGFTVCKNCYFAIYMRGNGNLKWEQPISWTIKNVLFEKLESIVEYDTNLNYGNERMTNFTSEIVNLPKMDSLNKMINDYKYNIENRTDCPHFRTNLYEWHDANTWDNYNYTIPDTSMKNISIPENKAVIIRSCSSVANETNPYQRIYVPESSRLIFDDSDMDFHVREILNYGNVYVGNENCRIYSKINFYFHGNKSDSSTKHNDLSRTSKGIISYGNLNIHGKLYHPTWTKLAYSAYIGDDRIYLQESVNWEPGMEIVIVTSVWEDYEDDHQNERLTIYSVGDSSWMEKNVIYFGNDTRLSHYHYSGLEYQTEVLLLTRNVKFIGMDTGDKFGGHSIVLSTSARGQLQGIEAINMGQQNVVARYPFHFHELDISSDSYITDTSVHSSNYRCWTIHGSHNTTLSRNVAYNIYGHCFYLEDGIEEDNTISYNAIAHVHPIHHIATGSCSGEYVCSGCNESWLSNNFYTTESNADKYYYTTDELAIPVDIAASGFYVTNTHNNFIGNIVSGGWSGFAMVNFKKPLGLSLGLDLGNLNPYNRMTSIFDGNIAHSSGFYWKNSGCGGCMYAGGELYYDYNYSSYVYYTAREEHNTIDADGNHEWNIFTNTKNYLCQLGFNYWGHRSQIIGYESHDVKRSVFFIGENVLRDALVNARSNNTRVEDLINSREGFQFYDTGSHLYLDNIIFRNFDYEEPIIKLLSFSDVFTPANIAASRKITFDNCIDPAYYIYDPYCGEEQGCTLNDGKDTQSSRNWAMYDYDGTASLTGMPTIISTHRDFWAVTGDCKYDNVTNLWYCPWYEKYLNKTWETDGYDYTLDNSLYDNTTESNFTFFYNLAKIELDIPGLTEGNRASDISDYPNIIGYVSQFGRNYSSPYSIYPGLAGPTNTGWYFRSIYGAPAFFTVGDSIMIPRKAFVLLCIKYPSNSQFNVTYDISGDTSSYGMLGKVKQANSFEAIAYSREDLYANDSDWGCPDYGNLDSSKTWAGICNDTGGYGPAWYWDGSEFFYLRLINPIIYSYWFHSSWVSPYFETDGMRLWDGGYIWTFRINVTCDGCTTTYDGFYDVDDSLPPKLATQQWESTGYYEQAMSIEIPTTTTTGDTMTDNNNNNNENDTTIEENEEDDDDSGTDTDTSTMEAGVVAVIVIGSIVGTMIVASGVLVLLSYFGVIAENSSFYVKMDFNIKNNKTVPSHTNTSTSPTGIKNTMSNVTHTEDLVNTREPSIEIDDV